ncbi:unnamed protein product [Caenorhabditis auriculariae]|uniref:T-box domain-containing protein n=1 Tax=Caenorhabditis auriculariae TaxID=2777116 RepID=A0A8S1HH04_9PELO|nr:unnamed protein product [Caenorhabditis auriculariae]
MFPTVKVSVSNVDYDALYYVFLDVIPVDAKRYRYIYNKSAWLTAGKAEPAPRNRLYLHPDSPFSGEQLLKQVISFEKAKLTNNEVDKAGHMTLTDEEHGTFVFPETQFMAVTAYQNQLITKLKIEKNPFAKGFRDPSGRSPDYEPSNDSPSLLLPNMYQPALLQHALLQQYYAKASAVRVMPPIGPSLLSQMLLYQMPFSLGAQSTNDPPATSSAEPARL